MHSVRNESTQQNKVLAEILPPLICIRLSPEAGRLYAAIWNSWNFRGVTELALSDEIVSKRARLGLWALKPAQDELINEGILKLSPHGDRILYRYAEPAA